MKNSMMVSQKIQHRIIIWSSNSTSGYILPTPSLRPCQKNKRLKARTKTVFCTFMFLDALFTRNFCSFVEVTKCPSTDGWINTSAIFIYDGIINLEKKWNSDAWNEPWGHYAMWNKSVPQDKYYMIPLIWGASSSEYIEIEIKMVVARD